MALRVYFGLNLLNPDLSLLMLNCKFPSHFGIGLNNHLLISIGVIAGDVRNCIKAACL